MIISHLTEKLRDYPSGSGASVGVGEYWMGKMGTWGLPERQQGPQSVGVHGVP